MARGRMLNKTVGASLQFHNLPDDTSRLLATWIIPHLDFDGVFHADPMMVRSAIFPRRADITVEQVESYLDEMERQGLIHRFKARGDVWQWWPGFSRNQTGLRRDRESTTYPPPPTHLVDEYRRDDDIQPDKGWHESGENPAEDKLSEGKDKVSEEKAKAVPPPRDYLDDTLSFSQKDKPNGRPEGWDHVSAAVFAICIRVADLWCAGKLPTGRWTERIEKQCAGASELLGYHDDDLQAALATVDKYHLHYKDDGVDFTVAGPQSLVNVIPPFMQSGGKKPRKRDLRRDGSKWTEEELAEARARSLAMEPLDAATFFDDT